MAGPPGTSTGGGDHTGGEHSGGQAAGTGGGGGGGGHGNPAMAAFFAQRQLQTEKMMKIFAASICGLIAVFLVFHWTRWLCVKVERKWKGASALGHPFVMVSRRVRNVLVRKIPGFKSAGHALLVAVYVAINATIMLTNLDISMGNVAARCGWMALSNMAFVVFLALKNTPLAFLTAYSYERLNCLHHVAGYIMFVYVVLHAALYTAFFNSQNRLLAIYGEREQIAAIVTGFAILSVIFSATFLRRVWYELFYVVHICSWIVAIVTIAIHQPEIGKGTLVVTLLTGSMWVLDRIIRACRVLYYSSNNEATLHPLANGGTKIVMKKTPIGAEPGKHCFVWIPAIRKFETHPFTIHKTEPVEFTVKAHNGFTRDLHKYAVANPGRAVTASVDGPYGTFPDPMEFDKIVLIAGGGGATFTFGLAVNVLERMKEESHKNVVFIWAVKKHENLSWFKEHLDVLKSHTHSPKIDVSLYVTRAPSSPPTVGHLHGLHFHPIATASRSSQSSEGGRSPPLSPISADVEKGVLQLPQPTHQPALTAGDLEKEMERTVETRVEHKDASGQNATITTMSHGYEHAIKPGRPDLSFLIRNAVTTTPSNQRVLVAACGPDGLMRVVRTTTAKLIRGDGPGVELHCEQFDW
ncbi:ferric reductase NAD binding domain-containing protein [Apodospora peruviana]|uniref:Ferric reductase NAD binding domain-containing protein n=1 Tax=Apodospora peruviana TaxID=516989 RepID=A0AAE0I1Q5_9PEZI|nr:ferric reductase NAD binding domain-containing protein [Apodospora peruviana]